MRWTPILCGVVVASACGDDARMSGDGSASESAGPTSLDPSLPTSGSSGASASDSESGSASMTAATVPTTGEPTVGPTGDTSTGEASASNSGTTTGTGPGETDGTMTGPDTGGDFCSMPNVPVEDVPLNQACVIAQQSGSFSPVVEWKYGTTPFCGPAVAGQTIDSNMSGKIDSKDLPLVFLYQQQKVVALWGDGSGVAWMTAGDYGQDGGLALGDLDGDGWSEIITANASTVCALDARDGAQKWCSPNIAPSLDPAGYSYPSIADMDGDGLAEVVAGNTILDYQGLVIGKGLQGKGAAPYGGNPNGGTYGALSAVVDLDGDGIQEVVTGNAAYDLDGNTIWQNGKLDGLVAVADFDGDGKGEIVKTTGIHVFGMDSEGNEVWGPVTYGGNLGVPAIDDLDGDGTPELVLGAQNQLVAMEWGGAVMWTATISDQSGAAGPVLFDFEKDGFPEVLYADEQTIRFFSGVDGSLKFQSGEHASYTILETPIVADVDGDDQVEIVLGHCNGNANIGAITVYGDKDKTWPPGRKIWNQHTYSITNVTDLGGIPSDFKSNWLGNNTFNSFRSGDAGQAPGEFYDLQAEIIGVCEDKCEMGNFYMAARIRNAGTLDAPAGLPVTVRAGLGGPIVVTQDTTQPVPAGKTGEILFFDFDAKKLAKSQPVITVDDTGVGEGELFECLSIPS